MPDQPSSIGTAERLELIQRFSEEAANLHDTSALERLFSATVRDFGYHAYDAWAVTRGTFSNLIQDQNMWAADYSPDVIKSFIRKGLISSCPATELASKSSEPFDYVLVLKRARPNASVRFQRATLKAVNVHHAWITPLNTIEQMRGVTLYLKGKGETVDRFFAETQMAAQLLSSSFMAALVRVNAPKPKPAEETVTPDLSAREIDCLSWVAKGKTNWEVSQVLGISENTVRFHLKNAFRKLDTTSRSSAVIRAIQAGLISP